MGDFFDRALVLPFDPQDGRWQGLVMPRNLEDHRRESDAIDETFKEFAGRELTCEVQAERMAAWREKIEELELDRQPV